MRSLKKKVKDKTIHHKYYININNQIDILQALINIIIKLNN